MLPAIRSVKKFLNPERQVQGHMKALIHITSLTNLLVRMKKIRTQPGSTLTHMIRMETRQVKLQ